MWHRLLAGGVSVAAADVEGDRGRSLKARIGSVNAGRGKQVTPRREPTLLNDLSRDVRLEWTDPDTSHAFGPAAAPKPRPSLAGAARRTTRGPPPRESYS